MTLEDEIKGLEGRVARMRATAQVGLLAARWFAALVLAAAVVVALILAASSSAS